VAEKASWRIGQQSAQLAAVRAEAKGLWQDSAGRRVDARYLRPHSRKAATMATELGSQERDLGEAAKARRSAGEHEKTAVREARVVSEELAASEQEVSIVYDYVTRSDGLEKRAAAMEQRCHALANQAGTACNGIQAEGGGGFRHRTSAQTRFAMDEMGQGGIDPAKVDDVWRHGIATQGGRAYYSPGDLKYSDMVASAEKLKPYPGEYTVDMHGDPDSVQVGSTHLNAAELAALIQRDPSWAGRPVRLFSCSTGAYSGGFAQQLADSLGVSVTAPDMSVWANDVPPWVGEGVSIGGDIVPTAFGGWHRFDPRG